MVGVGLAKVVVGQKEHFESQVLFWSQRATNAGFLNHSVTHRTDRLRFTHSAEEESGLLSADLLLLSFPFKTPPKNTGSGFVMQKEAGLTRGKAHPKNNCTGLERRTQKPSGAHGHMCVRVLHHGPVCLRMQTNGGIVGIPARSVSPGFRPQGEQDPPFVSIFVRTHRPTVHGDSSRPPNRLVYFCQIDPARCAAASPRRTTQEDGAEGGRK